MKDSYKYEYTVFTPCYNSVKFLHRLYKSLTAQTFKDFEWLVINDASTDGTKELICSYIKEDLINIQFINNDKNQMLAKNCFVGVEKARGEFFMFIGHDDELIPEALEIFYKTWESISPAQKNNLAGMMCNCKDQYGRLVVDKFPDAPCIDGFFEMYFDKNVKGEKFFCYLTDIMKENQFSVVDLYVPENTVLMAISDKYLTYFFNEELRIYYINQENHESFSSIKKIAYPKGIRFSKLEDINRRLKKLMRHPVLTFKTFANYSRMSIHSKISFKQAIEDIQHPIAKALTVLIYPVGSVLAKCDKIKKLI